MTANAKPTDKSSATQVYDVAFGLDAAYLPHAGTAIASLVSASPAARFRFIMLSSDIGPDDRRRLELCAPAAEFNWLDIDDPQLLSLEKRAHFSAAASYRLALERLAPPDVKRILYLDCDVIALGDIAELWHTDMQGNAVAAVADPGIDAKSFSELWNLPFDGNAYFNSGVLLIDLEAVRQSGGFVTAQRFLVDNHSVLSFADQDALNYAFWGRWLQLDPKWNWQRTMAILQGGRGKPAIIHFTTEHKPWLRDSFTPYAWLYWVNLMRTPFRKDVEKASAIRGLDRLRMFVRYVRRIGFHSA